MDEQTLTFIPASEAAEMVGVSAQTIRNLCKAGTIRYQLRSQLFYACKEDVEQYMQSITEVHEIEQSIEEYKAQKEELSELLRDAIHEQKERLDTMNMFPERIKCITNLMAAIVPHFVSELSAREIEVVMELLKGGKWSEMAKDLQLSRLRALYIFDKAVEKIQAYPDMLTACEQMLDSREREIEELMQQITDLKSRCSVEDGAEQTTNNSILMMPIRDIDFSTRTWNALVTAEIETIGDLVKCRRDDLLKYRNFGKKSLAEIEDWLEAHGLALAE